VWFSFLHPAGSDIEERLIGEDVSDNDQSCVLLVQLGKSTALFPGDIEKAGEALLLSRIESPKLVKKRTDKKPKTAQLKPLALAEPLTLLVAPHHGSRSSSTNEFIDAWQPEHVVFPAGHKNRLGFPHDDVLMRYKIWGSEPYVTGRDGAIGFFLGPNGLTRSPTRYWLEHRRLWHTPKR